MLVVKVKFGEDTRRVTLDATPSFDDLNKLLCKLFNLSQFNVKYLDDDGDLVTLSSDIELNEAIKVASRESVLRLFLFVDGSSNKVPDEPAPTKEGKHEIPTGTGQGPTNPPNPFANLFGNATPQSGFNPIAQLLNNPQIAAFLPQLLSNPQVAAFLPQLLSNPQIAAFIPQLLQVLQQHQPNPSGNQSSQSAPNVTLEQLFQNLGLNSQGTPSNPSANESTANQNAQPNPFAQMFQQFQNSGLWNDLQSAWSPSAWAQNMENPNSNGCGTGSNPNCNMETPESTSNTHVGVQCDGCGGGVVGIRYKCSVCADFDLCESCEKKGAHDEAHPLLKITRPVQLSGRGRGCPYVHPWARGGLHHGGHHGGGHWGGRRAERNNQERYLARFVCDVSVLDGTVVTPGQNFVKIWRIRNEGTAVWPQGARLTFVGGDKLSPFASVPAPQVEAGAEVDIAVDMCAPSKPGRYIGYWRLNTTDGTRFGQRVWVDITVEGPENKETQESVPVAKETAPPVEEPATVPVPQQMEVEVSTAPPTIPVPIQIEPASVPEVPIVVEKVYNPQVQAILSMGFNDADRIEQLLEKNNYDMTITIQNLLE